MAVIPKRVAATGADAAISVTREVTHQRIGLSLSFPGQRLDVERLARAVRLSLDKEPLVGCAFRTDKRRAYWDRIARLDPVTAFSLIEGDDAQAAMRAFQADEISDDGPQAAVALFRTGEGDSLGIKISHVLADGQAAKQYAYQLADLYARLEDDPTFVPEPNHRPRPSGRDVWASLSPQQRRAAKKAKSWAKPTWPAPWSRKCGEGLTYRWVTLHPEQFGRLKSYGAERGCTVNDMMLTAVLRACIVELDPPIGVPLSLMYTADLRRYLQDADGLPISNLSISGSLGIERVEGEKFEDTLLRVHQRMAEWAEMCHGAGPLAGAERMAGLGYRTTERLLKLTFRLGSNTGMTYPWFTNIGIIDDERLVFDGVKPEAALMFGPTPRGPGIVPVISTYRDTMAICMGYCESDLDESWIAKLLTAVTREIDDAVS